MQQNNQPQMHPDQLRSSLGFLTNLQEHLLNHQHPELQAKPQAQKSPEAPQSPQNAPESTPNTKAQKVPAKKEKGANPEFEKQVMEQLQTLQVEVEAILKEEKTNEPTETKQA